MEFGIRAILWIIYNEVKSNLLEKWGEIMLDLLPLKVEITILH